MDKKGDSGSPGWTASLMQTTEDVAKAVGAVHLVRPSVVFSSKDEGSSSQLQKLQHQLSKVIKGFSSPLKEKKKTYNPEILTSQKRQWARFQLRSLDQRPLKEPSRIFESLVVVGLPPSSDVQAFEKQLFEKTSYGSRRLKSVINNLQSVEVEVNLEPQVLFVYPPEKQLPLKYKDLLSFCFPGGLEVHAVERTPSMSELNEILLGQEHLKQSGQSFVFRLQVADNLTLYGCCVLVEEIVQKPSTLISMLYEEKGSVPNLSRCIITAPRILTEERLQLLEEDILNFATSAGYSNDDCTDDTFGSEEFRNKDTERVRADHLDFQAMTSDSSVSGIRNVTEYAQDKIDIEESNGGNDRKFELQNDVVAIGNSESKNGLDLINSDQTETSRNRPTPEKYFPESVLPLLRYHQYESSESSSRSEIDDSELEEPSSSGRDEHDEHNDILEWAKANNHGSLQIICEYYKLQCPKRGSKLTFYPLEHLHPLEFHRPGETVLYIAGSTIDLRSCGTSLEVLEAHNALLVEEEATALSVWAVACICGNLGLENVLMMFAGALLEKQIVVVCSNLGILCASVLSIIPLIRPYQWQSLLIPALPYDIMDFLDAPVPYIVGIKDKTAEVQSRLANTSLIDVDKNQVKSLSIPKLPQHKELLASLSPYHETLVGESYLAQRRPVYEYTDAQAEAAKGFLAVLRSYLDSLCSNLRSHTITNVQTSNDKVSLLLKESFIDSFPSQDRHFMKLFVDTQLFSVHTDLVLSFYQKD